MAGDWSVAGATWSPDGRRVAYVADPDPDGDLLGRTRVFTIDAAGSEEAVEVAALAGACRTPAWSPDGSHIAFRGVDAWGEPWGTSESVWVVPASGGAARDLAPERHLYAGPSNSSDLTDWRREGGDALAWDGPDAVLCQVTERGTTSVWRFPLSGEPRALAGSDAPFHRAVAGSEAIVLLAAGAAGAAEIEIVEGGVRRRLTQHGSAWAAPLASDQDGHGRRPRSCGADPHVGASRPRARTGRFPRCSRSTAVPAAPGARFPGCPISHWSTMGIACSARIRGARDRMAAHGSSRSPARGAEPTPRISSRSATGPSTRGSPIPPASPCSASATAGS